MSTTDQQMNQFKVIQVICAALIVGVVLFLVISVLITDQLNSIYDQKDFMLPVAYLILLTGIIAALYVVKRFSEPSDSSNLKAKLGNYQLRMIIRMALLEAPALFAIVQFMLSGSLWYLFVPVFSVIMMVYLFPVKSKFITEYKLTFEERKTFDKMN